MICLSQTDRSVRPTFGLTKLPPALFLDVAQKTKLCLPLTKRVTVWWVRLFIWSRNIKTIPPFFPLKFISTQGNCFSLTPPKKAFILV